MNDVARCVCLRWAPAESRENDSELNRIAEKNSRTTAKNRLEGFFSKSTLSTAPVVWLNIALPRFTTKLSWSCPRIYVYQCIFPRICNEQAESALAKQNLFKCRKKCSKKVLLGLFSFDELIGYGRKIDHGPLDPSQ